MRRTARTPAGWLFDRLRPRERRIRALERQAAAYLETLLAVNASRITNDFDDRVRESRLHFQSEIRAALAEVAGTAERALARANAQRTRGRQAVEAEVDRIDGLLRQLAAGGG